MRVTPKRASFIARPHRVKSRASPSASAPWAPPNKKTSPVVSWQQTACASPRRSCHFNEYFNCLSPAGLRSKRNTPSPVIIPKKNSPRIPGGGTASSNAVHRVFEAIHADVTVLCQTRLRPLATRARGVARRARSLDQRWAHVYSPIIRTGHSPPSQLSTLVLVIPGKGFLCLQCEERGNLVEYRCVVCGQWWSAALNSHHIL